MRHRCEYKYRLSLRCVSHVVLIRIDSPACLQPAWLLITGIRTRFLMSPSFIPSHVPAYDGVQLLRDDVVALVEQTWHALLDHSNRNIVNTDKAHALAAAPAFASTSVPALNVSVLINNDTNIWQRLRHPLSSQALARMGAPSDEKVASMLGNIAKRNTAEWSALNIFGGELIAAFDATLDGSEAGLLDDHSVHGFTACLENIATHLLNTDTRIRTTPSVILPDRKGVGWQCVPADKVVMRLAELHRYITAHHVQSPLQTAIVALVMISCIHPFTDGNGRVSRVVFHAILRKYCVSPKFYIPLKNFYARSDFGFEIRLRQTFLTSDWNQITHYFCDVLRALID